MLCLKKIIKDFFYTQWLHLQLLDREGKHAQCASELNVFVSFLRQEHKAALRYVICKDDLICIIFIVLTSITSIVWLLYVINILKYSSSRDRYQMFVTTIELNLHTRNTISILINCTTHKSFWSLYSQIKYYAIWKFLCLLGYISGGHYDKTLLQMLFY